MRKIYRPNRFKTALMPKLHVSKQKIVIPVLHAPGVLHAAIRPGLLMRFDGRCADAVLFPDPARDALSAQLKIIGVIIMINLYGSSSRTVSVFF